ncbi:MAG: nucleoside-diphosphate kinase [Alphaproteobacteria bacterium]|nr:nucleoside-diphosphate kinase [Alphaproteobacteria bacterium]
MIERTLVIIKPDGVQRKLCGRILTTFEEAGYDVLAAKMVKPTRDLIDRHYPKTKAYIESLGVKSKNNFAQQGFNIKKMMGTDDAVVIGREIRGWLVDYISQGRVMAFVLEGNNAIKGVRKLCGTTMPMDSDPGSIRGKFSLDSSDLANEEKRAIRNLLHASGNLEEAKYEINLWFGQGYY